MYYSAIKKKPDKCNTNIKNMPSLLHKRMHTD